MEDRPRRPGRQRRNSPPSCRAAPLSNPRAASETNYGLCRRHHGARRGNHYAIGRHREIIIEEGQVVPIGMFHTPPGGLGLVHLLVNFLAKQNVRPGGLLISLDYA